MNIKKSIYLYIICNRNHIRIGCTNRVNIKKQIYTHKTYYPEFRISCYKIKEIKSFDKSIIMGYKKELKDYIKKYHLRGSLYLPDCEISIKKWMFVNGGELIYKHEVYK